MYKKGPPSEADCLLLALELLYLWRAFYTCSETVLNRILSGKTLLYLKSTISLSYNTKICLPTL